MNHDDTYLIGGLVDDAASAIGSSDLLCTPTSIMPVEDNGTHKPRSSPRFGFR